jgi:hypothetical protein
MVPGQSPSAWMNCWPPDFAPSRHGKVLQSHQSATPAIRLCECVSGQRYRRGSERTDSPRSVRHGRCPGLLRLPIMSTAHDAAAACASRALWLACAARHRPVQRRLRRQAHRSPAFGPPAAHRQGRRLRPGAQRRWLIPVRLLNSRLRIIAGIRIEVMRLESS